MIEKTYQTPSGTIHYWVSFPNPGQVTLAFLPGLTADHRLFEKQIEYFEGKYNLFVWDAPGHNRSWPFRFDFSLMDKARWLKEILEENSVERPIIIGQSMGGYLGQAFAQLFPAYINGFVSIDSAPLQRKYYTGWELWLLKRMEPVYSHYPWKSLVKSGSKGVAVTEYGRALMHQMMMTYDGNQDRYARLAGHGYRILAEAVEQDLPYELSCPVRIICGKQDRAGSCIRYNKAWHRDTGFPMAWLDKCGHNANTDRPEKVNQIIEDLVRRIK